METVRPNLQVNIAFSRFVRYFVPGWFSAFWIIFYLVRYSHPEIEMGNQLLSYFYSNWLSLVPTILALGGFLGICFVGLDSIIFTLMGSRTLDSILKYFLSSPVFHKFPFISFMRFRRMRESFDRLPMELARECPECMGRIRHIANGPYSSRCFLREILQNHFWYDQINRNVRLEMKQIMDISSMFFYISSVCLVFFVLQLFLYIAQIVDIPNILTAINILNIPRVVNIPQLLSIRYDNAVPLALFAYVGINLSANVFWSFWRTLSRRKSPVLEETPIEPLNRWARFKRVELIMVGFALFIIYLCALYYELIDRVIWFHFLDPLLLGVLFILTISTYWAGAFEYCRFFINYNRYFQAKRQQITSYIVENSISIRQAHDKICGVLIENEPRNTQVPEGEALIRCSQCDAPSSRVLECNSCGAQFCLVCASHLENCPKCNTLFTGHDNR